MNIKLLSDLHFEFGTKVKDRIAYNGEDVLVLAGDIAVGHKAVLQALDYFLDLGFPDIVYVPGNHEYYKQSIDYFDKAIEDNAPPHVHFLNPGTVKIKDTVFTGATLWTNFRNDPLSEMIARRTVNDFRYIRNFTTHTCKELFYKHWGFIKNNPADVVVTHFLPTPYAIHGDYAGEPTNAYFANELSQYIYDLNPTLWMFGHTHRSVNKWINQTQLLANPYGYEGYGQNQDFYV